MDFVDILEKIVDNITRMHTFNILLLDEKDAECKLHDISPSRASGRYCVHYHLGNQCNSLDVKREEIRALFENCFLSFEEKKEGEKTSMEILLSKLP